MIKIYIMINFKIISEYLYLNIESNLFKNIQNDQNLVFKVTTTILLSLGCLYLLKIWHSYSFFTKRGIRTPPIEFFFGNARPIFKNKNISEQLRDWTKIYGKVFGFFEGHQPVFVTSDVDIIQECLIKQASNFSARKVNFRYFISHL